MPSSSTVSSTDSSGSRQNREYSLCSAVTGLDGVGAADGRGAGLGQAEVPDLAGRDELLDRAGDVLDGHLRVDAVLVEQVDDVGAKASK